MTDILKTSNFAKSQVSCIVAWRKLLHHIANESHFTFDMEQTVSERVTRNLRRLLIEWKYDTRSLHVVVLRTRELVESVNANDKIDKSLCAKDNKQPH